MFSHAGIWRLIDDLAARNGLSASGLARRSGLDPTAFNKSKRTGVDGRLRWPSTESIAKVLDATGTPLEDLLLAVGRPETKGAPSARRRRPEPGDGFAEAERPALPSPAGTDCDLVVLPEPALPPLFRPGDRLIVDRAAPVRPGDRVLVTRAGGALAIGEVRSLAGGLSLATPGAGDDSAIEAADVVSVARILWVSQ